MEEGYMMDNRDDIDDPDDEEMGETPKDVIEILGFDPKEFETKTTTDSFLSRIWQKVKNA
jgi:hypothetical protein